jgi:hypothetical protein
MVASLYQQRNPRAHPHLKDGKAGGNRASGVEGAGYRPRPYANRGATVRITSFTLRSEFSCEKGRGAGEGPAHGEPVAPVARV